MPSVIRQQDTGDLYYLQDDGSMQFIEEPGLMAQAGRQVADIGSGIQSAYGNLTDQPELIAQAEADTAARNQAFAGADEAYPWQSLAGQAIPSLATIPLTGGSSLLGQVATNMAVGAAETGLDLGEGGSFGQRATAGAAGGLLGDLGGRMLGRVWGAGKGLYADITKGRQAASSQAARKVEDLGGATLASQRMEPGTVAQRQMARLEQGAEAGIAPPGLIREAGETNRELQKNTLLSAVGLDGAQYGDIGPDTLLDANRQISDGFSQVAADAGAQGPIEIGGELADRIANTKGQVPQLMARGRFAGLEHGILSGQEWNVARRALAQDAANAAGKGDYELADDIFADVEELDRIIEPLIGEEALQNFARLREQYRVLKIASKPGVINQAGEVSVRNLNRALNAGTGFGTTAQQGLETVNPESKALIETARAFSHPDVQPFRSSGTAENQAVRQFVGDTLSGPLGPVRAAGQLLAPMAIGQSSRGGGRAVEGMLTPAPVQAVVGGAQVGRAALDELFYPFVGSRDDRPQ